jgi:hypothetical protein
VNVVTVTALLDFTGCLGGKLVMLLFCLTCRCSKELNQWDLLLDYARDKGVQNPFLILEIAWRVPDWNLMKEALSQVEMSCPKEMMWKVRGCIS